MKSLLSIIGVTEFEKAAARATKRAAKATLAAGGSYLGMIDGEIVQVKAKVSSTAKAFASNVVMAAGGHVVTPSGKRGVKATADRQSSSEVRVIQVATPATQAGITRAIRAEKAPKAVVTTSAKKNLVHG